MYDLTIIGAGWAGFNAAIRARSLGLRTALIEESFIGGTCLNRGCIPTKTLVQSAKVLELARKAGTFGIKTGPAAEVDLELVQARKARIVQQLRQSMESRLSGIDYLAGQAEIISNQQVKVNGKDIPTKNILLAAGSTPCELAGFAFDNKKIFSSDQILELTKLPGSLLIIGAGVVGCEFAQIFSSFGTKVTVADVAPQILPGVDSEIARKLETVFKKKRIAVFTSSDARKFDLNGFEMVLVCVGRKPRIDGLDKAGIAAEKSAILVDDYLRCSLPNVYAAGDCTGKLMLAHFAGYQGICAAENIRYPQELKKADNNIVPSCIFTSPEISSVGLSEEQARQSGPGIKINKFDFLGSGMARIQDEAEGFIKIISEQKSGKVLGAQIIGPKATELISFFTLAISENLTVSQLKKTIFAHPTLSEAIMDALEQE